MAINTKSKIELKQMLYRIPSDKLEEIKNFIEFILKKNSKKTQSKRVEKLEGIWAGLGFEKIANLEKAIKEVRKDSEDLLLERVQKWNT